jgi:hypothetical protein
MVKIPELVTREFPTEVYYLYTEFDIGGHDAYTNA